MHQKVKEREKKKHGKKIEDGRCAVWDSPMGSSVEYGSKFNTTEKMEFLEWEPVLGEKLQIWYPKL